MFSREKAIRQLNALSKNPKEMRLAAEQWGSEFQTLVSIILSARTLDETTIGVCKKLFSRFPDAEALSKAPLGEVEKIIMPVNFYQNKARYIINCARTIVANFEGKVPHEIESLTTLPGVGRKTANVFLSQYGKDAIGVDTHVSYISQKLGWTENSNPEKIEKDLERLFPKESWSRINPTLVRFGKSHTSRFEKDKILERIKAL